MPQSSTFTHTFSRPPDPLYGLQVLTIEVPADKYIRNVRVATVSNNGGSADLSGLPVPFVSGSQQVAVAWALAPFPGSRVEFTVSWDVADIQQGVGRILLFKDRDFEGSMLEVVNANVNLVPVGFNDLTSSIVVLSGTWAFYQDIDFLKPYTAGRALRVLGRGMYPWIPEQGLPNDQLSSLRAVG